jgi:hypothetical protein
MFGLCTSVVLGWFYYYYVYLVPPILLRFEGTVYTSALEMQGDALARYCTTLGLRSTDTISSVYHIQHAQLLYLVMVGPQGLRSTNTSNPIQDNPKKPCVVCLDKCTTFLPPRLDNTLLSYGTRVVSKHAGFVRCIRLHLLGIPPRWCNYFARL